MQQLKPFRALIVDDEPLSRGYLHALTEQDARFEVAAVCESGLEAVAIAIDSPPDVAFLDVRMPGLDGFQTLEKIKQADLLVVLVTAYSEYAVRAYDCGAFDYVTKPIDPSRFAETLNRVSARLLEREAAQSGGAASAPPPSPAAPTQQEKRLLSGVRQDMVFAESEIEVVESHGNYVRVRINDESCLVRQSLDSFCGQLDSSTFVRTHRSFVVNIACVRTIRYGRSGTAELELASGLVVQVSRRHRNTVVEALRSTLPQEP